MKNKYIFIISAIGIVLGLISAYVYSQQPRPQPPVFNPAPNPYTKGIYTDGIIESDQPQGENINIYPEVSGPITQILVAEGSIVHKGDALLTIDDSVQRATAAAAHALLDELKAEPRPETLDVNTAQVENAKATLKNAQDELAKQEKSYQINPKSISLDALDNARNAEKIAETNLIVIEKQYELTKAGAWTYDIENQEKQAEAADALLAKYTIRAPQDGVVLTVQSTVGSYVSTQGAYDSYTQGFNPLIVLGAPQDHLNVRAYVDEILVHRLVEPDKLEAQMFIRGTDTHIPLTFVRIQPFISPKIELSDERQERVDVRVLPMIFRFDKPKDINLFPGQLVDVYIGEKGTGTAAKEQP